MCTAHCGRSANLPLIGGRHSDFGVKFKFTGYMEHEIYLIIISSIDLSVKGIHNHDISTIMIHD